MPIKSLKLRLKKNHSSESLPSATTESEMKAEAFKESQVLEQDETEATETEATASEEDESKYGYNTYDTAFEQEEEPSRATVAGGGSRRANTCSPMPNRGSSSSHSTRRSPCRSSLKASNSGSTPRRLFRRNSLTFSKDVTVKTITPIQSLAKKKSLWFEDKDYEKMQKKIHLIAEKAKEGHSSKKYCTRGLENVLEPDSSEHRRYAAWDAVMDEQYYQQESGMEHYDEDALSNSYREACADSQAEAATRALEDEKAVAEYLSETRNYCRRMSM